MTPEQVARVAHEVNRAYVRIHGVASEPPAGHRPSDERAVSE